MFINTISKSFPNLEYLSMMNNEAAPSYFNGGSYMQFKDYRLIRFDTKFSFKINEY